MELTTEILEEKELFIFDLDGTITDSLDVWNKTDQNLIKELTGRVIDKNTIFYMRDQFLEKSTARGREKYDAYHQYLKEVFHLHISAEEVAQRRNEYADYLVKQEVVLMPYALETIRHLKKLKKQIALATMTTKAAIDIYNSENKNVKPLDFYNVFDKIVTINDLVCGKPNREVHDKILASLKQVPEKSIILEDSGVGITCANNAEIDSIYIYGNSQENREKIKKNATYSVESLEKIYTLLPKKC